MPKSQLRPAPEPVEAGPVPVVLTGTGLWVAALLVAWVLGEDRAVQTSIAGIALGLTGLAYSRWHERRRAKRASENRAS